MHRSRALILFLLALIGATLIVFNGCNDSSDRINFSQDAWRNPASLSAKKDGEKSPRVLMAEDLIKQRLLIGKTKLEIKRLLGKPDDQGDIVRSRKKYWYYSYSLGQGWGLFPVDQVDLNIYFNSSGRVVYQEVYQRS